MTMILFLITEYRKTQPDPNAPEFIKLCDELIHQQKYMMLSHASGMILQRPSFIKFILSKNE